MSRSCRVLAAVIMVIAACAIGIPPASSTTAYDYDGTRTTSVAGGSGATEAPHEQAITSRSALGDRAPGAYDHPAHLARAFARPGEYPSAPNTADDVVGAADDVARYGSTPGGRPYTRHYGTETGPQRNVPGSVVDEAIDNYPGKLIGGGKTVHYDPVSDITVVTGNGQSIVSAHRGPPRAGQR